MIGRLRLIDAVIVAAVALLGLKTLGVFAPRPEGPPTAAPEALPAFARVLAHARTNYVPPDVAMTGAVDKKEEKASAAAPAPPPEPAFKPVPPAVSPSERALLERLGERRDELQQRGREMEMRERLIQDAEKKLEGRLNELKAKEEVAEGAAAKKAGPDGGGLKSLVTMYEIMKPKDAARVFDRLPHEVLVPVVTGMKPAKMAEVLALMSPEAAEKLTVALATRAKSASAGEKDAALLPPNELPGIEPPARPPR